MKCLVLKNFILLQESVILQRSVIDIVRHCYTNKKRIFLVDRFLSKHNTMERQAPDSIYNLC